MRKSIFGDFLSPDNRIIYGTYENLSDIDHYNVLSSSLNIAVLLAGENVIVPPFFPFQCPIVRTLLKNKKQLIDEGYIVFPLRENTLSAFFEKKREEYANAKEVYAGVYNKKGEGFLIGRTPNIIRRRIKMGAMIARAWEEAPDISESWCTIKEDLSAKEVDRLRIVPMQLKDSGSAVTWPAMANFLNKYRLLNDFTIRKLGTKLDEAIQHEYVRTYLKEYNATIVSRIPPKTTDLFLTNSDLSYDYWTFRQILKVIQLWDIFSTLSAKDIVKIKSSAAFFKFIEIYDAVCSSLVASRVVGLFSEVALEPSINEIMRSIEWNIFGINIHITSMQAIEDLLYSVAIKAQDLLLCIDGAKIYKYNEIGESNKMKKVFLVHGQNDGVRNSINMFLTSLGLEVIVMALKPHSTRTLPEKFEQLAGDCDYAVVVATGDDILQKGKDTVIRARQNVLVEIGYFWGALGRATGKWSLLIEEPNIEIPSDIQGLGYIPITADLGETKLQLRQELDAAGVI